MVENTDAWTGADSYYKSHMDALFSDVQYILPRTKIGNFTISLYETYKHSNYIDTERPRTQSTNDLGGFVQWSWKKNKVNWFAAIGVNWLHSSSTTLAKSNNLVIPTPRAKITWRPVKKMRFALGYSYTGYMPSIAQLSETDNWIDNKLVYHGNSLLKPYTRHLITFDFIWNHKYINIAWTNSFEYSSNYICDMYTATDEYILQTLVNLSQYRELSSMLDFTIKPLGNNLLTFWNRIILADVRGKNAEYSWNGSRFQWMSSLSLNLKHWSAELFYQYPGKVTIGHLIRPRGQYWSATVYYRPVTNLSVGVEWSMPFGKSFKESEYTVSDAPVYTNTITRVKDWANLVSLKLSYNFSFGKNKNTSRPQFENGDNDTGLLRK